MASQSSPPKDRRRSERLLLRVPVKIYGKGPDGRPAEEAAEVVIVSRHGALLRSASALERGVTIELFNQYTRKQASFKVIWCSDRAVSERWDVGLETEAGSEEFWGIQFPSK